MWYPSAHLRLEGKQQTRRGFLAKGGWGREEHASEISGQVTQGSQTRRDTPFPVRSRQGVRRGQREDGVAGGLARWAASFFLLGPRSTFHTRGEPRVRPSWPGQCAGVRLQGRFTWRAAQVCNSVEGFRGSEIGNGGPRRSQGRRGAFVRAATGRGGQE